MKESRKVFYKDLIKVLVISLVLAGVTRWLIFLPFKVQGASMEDNFYTSDYLIVDRVTPKFDDYNRGEVVVFRLPGISSYYIKRIIGLPGEGVDVRDGSIYINGKFLDESKYLIEGRRFTPSNTSIALGEDEYFVLGDNREASYDSRSWGSLGESHIVGRVFLRLLPLDNFKKF